MLDEVEFKAGHPPADKVGGRRIATRKDRKISDSMPVEHSASSESSDDGNGVVREMLDAALPAKMEKSYPTIEVKKMHNKPIPAREAHRGDGKLRGPAANHQPRKITH